jgi:sugar/nucleoside kinase (ribokinase family)
VSTRVNTIREALHPRGSRADALLHGEGLESAVRFANRLAGLECTRRGLAGHAARIERRC